jgi:hypothetical protein
VGRRPYCAIVEFIIRCPHWRSRPFAWSGRRRIDRAIRCYQLRAITSRRTIWTDVFSTSRMRTTLGPFDLRAAFTEPCRPSDVPVVTRRHARPALFGGFKSAFADRCAVRDTLLADGATEIDLRARGPRVALAGESKTGESPETPSVVSRAREPRPTNRMSAKLLIAYAHMRTASPSLHSSPRQAVVRASFRLAPRSHHEAFRPPGVQDARCVRPTSATQSNCVYPYLVRSRPAIATFAAWAPHGVFGSMRYCRGKG